MNKADIRNVYKEKRKQLTAQQIEKYNDLILINFQKIALPFISCVHLYLPSKNLVEADTELLLRYLKFKNPEIRILVPKMDVATGDMHHIQLLEETELRMNPFGIHEPESGVHVEPTAIDLVIVPLLAFDKNGYRVGYGKGFYDRFLKKCRKEVIKIGISFFEPEDKIDDINQYDIPLNYCITPQQVYEF